MFNQPRIDSSLADSNRRFYPPHPDSRPIDLFTVGWNACSVPGHRFIRNSLPKQMLMFTDGACSNNGQPGARGGCGIVYTSIGWADGIAVPLEIDGTPHTSNRAELRAAILALGMRVWNGEGFNHIILACDSKYVVDGICEWVGRWVQNDWRTSSGDVKNKDLWQALLDELRKQESRGVLVQFWKIPRGWNEADPYAKQATVSILSLVTSLC